MIEHLKPFLIEHQTKALVLVPNNMIQTSTFTKELLGKFSHQNKTQYRKWCTGNTYITSRLRKKLNETQSDIERKKLEKQILKEKISEIYEITTHKKWELTIQHLSDEDIKRQFSNRIIVVDEVQRAKNSSSQFYSILERVLRIANNVYLFVLSGTPMVDDPIELCQPINLCRINEGLTELLEPKTIKQFYSNNIEKSNQAKQTIERLIKGLYQE
jgi:nucleoside-triphosphatase THEP1